jgi:hypothetical protein
MDPMGYETQPMLTYRPGKQKPAIPGAVILWHLSSSANLLGCQWPVVPGLAKVALKSIHVGKTTISHP